MSKIRGNVAIVGIGEVPTGRFPEKGAISFALESARMAIADAGLSKDDIDYVIPTGAMFSTWTCWSARKVMWYGPDMVPLPIWVPSKAPVVPSNFRTSLEL